MGTSTIDFNDRTITIVECRRPWDPEKMARTGRVRQWVADHATDFTEGPLSDEA